MSDEVKRLCNVIIRHVADGATIFEKDHAAIIDTMRSQQAEIERLRELLGTVFSRHHAQIDEPLYTDIVMETGQ